jgi:hypothetical protein
VCPKGIGLGVIARMNRDYLRASVESGAAGPGIGGATRSKT